MRLTDEDKQWLREALDNIENRLMNANVASISRQKGTSAAIYALELEIDALKKRVEEFENPAA